MSLLTLEVLGLSKSGVRRVILLILLVMLVVMAGRFTFANSTSVLLFRHTAYWFTTASVLLWAYVGWRMWRTRDWGALARESFVRRDLPWLATVMLVTFVGAFLHQEPGLKIVNDEPSQLATAKSLYERREAVIVYRSYDVGKGMEPTHVVVDKRPVLYAWLVAQAHTLTGYRESNGFWVTRLLALCTTLALYVLGRRMAGPAGGAVLAMLMLLPTMQSHLANAGGFEMMNLLFIVLLGLAICWYFDRPDEWSEAWLALTFVMLSQMRYESVVFALPAVVAVLMVWRSGIAPRLGWAMLMSPLLVLPRLWLQSIFGQGDNWQLQSKPEAAGEPFSARFFHDNVGHTLNYFFSLDDASTNSILLSGLGLGCAGFWVMLVSKRLRTEPSAQRRLVDWAPHVLWIGLSAHLLLMMFYFWGQFDDPLTQRLALPTHLWLALPVVGIWATLKQRERWQAPLVAALVLIFLSFTVPQLRANRFYELNHTSRAQNKVREWMSANPSDNRLVINNIAMATWLSGDNAVVSTKAMRAMPDRIRFQWERQTFSEVLALMREAYDPRTNQWEALSDDQLGPDFDYEEVWTLWCTPIYRFRLVRVTEIRNDHPGWQPTELTPAESGALWKARGEYIPEWSGHMP